MSSVVGNALRTALVAATVAGPGYAVEQQKSELNPCEVFVAAREFIARQEIDVSSMQAVSIEYSAATDTWLVIYRNPADPDSGAGHFGITVRDRRPIRLQLAPGL